MSNKCNHGNYSPARISDKRPYRRCGHCGWIDIDPNWVLIDSDNNQYRRDDGTNPAWETAFTFWQGGVTGTVRLWSMELEEVSNIVSAYGYKWNGTMFVNGSGDHITNHILAECVFEVGLADGKYD